MNSSPTPSPGSSTLGYPTQGVATLTEGLQQMLTRSSSAHRMVASLLVGYWGACPDKLQPLLSNLLMERTTYEEIVPFLVAMQRECHVS